jgi:hypothetical protein
VLREEEAPAHLAEESSLRTAPIDEAAVITEVHPQEVEVR